MESRSSGYLVVRVRVCVCVSVCTPPSPPLSCYWREYSDTVYTQPTASPCLFFPITCSFLSFPLLLLALSFSHVHVVTISHQHRHYRVTVELPSFTSAPSQQVHHLLCLTCVTLSSISISTADPPSCTPYHIRGVPTDDNPFLLYRTMVITRASPLRRAWQVLSIDTILVRRPRPTPKPTTPTPRWRPPASTVGVSSITFN